MSNGKHPRIRLNTSNQPVTQCNFLGPGFSQEMVKFYSGLRHIYNRKNNLYDDMIILD